MSPSSILPPLFLCISLLFIPIVSPQTQQSPSNGGNGSNATANPAAPRRTKASFAREFLTAHNKVRTNVAHPLLSWDKVLARYARRWGMKRTVDCKMVHSYGPYGENLFWGSLDHWTPTEAVESWSKEKEFYDAQTNACSEGQMCGHYTQIIWRDSAKLGCSRVKCNTGGVLMICEYYPPGNYVNESPFKSVAKPTPTANAAAQATPTANPAAQATPTANAAAQTTPTANGGGGGAAQATPTTNGGNGAAAQATPTANGGGGGGTAAPSLAANNQMVSPPRKIVG